MNNTPLTSQQVALPVGSSLKFTSDFFKPCHCSGSLGFFQLELSSNQINILLFIYLFILQIRTWFFRLLLQLTLWLCSPVVSNEDVICPPMWMKEYNKTNAKKQFTRDNNEVKTLFIVNFYENTSESILKLRENSIPLN